MFPRNSPSLWELHIMSKKQHKMILPWKRFWVPLGSEISCGMCNEGFFDDPDGPLGYRNQPIAHPLKDLLKKQCLILSGEPGLGKSVALEQVFPSLDHAGGGNEETIWIRFRDIPDAPTFTRRVLESRRWRTWIAGDQEITLVLDGLDEGLIKIKDFVSYLTAELRAAPLDRLHLIVACRSKDWPTAAGNKLLGLWGVEPAQSIWELCPLRQADVELAATSYGIDAPNLLKQISERGAIALAARPTTLVFLLRRFVATGQLDESRYDLYEHGLLDLCSEPDPERAEGLNASGQQTPCSPAQEIRDMAGYLAAMLIFSGKSAISTGIHDNEFVQSDLHWDSLCGELTRRKLSVPALGTAIFSSQGENRLGFAHQTFAEYLAAWHVRNMPLVQLRKLLCGFDGKDEHVVPQLAETAAWLAVINEEFLEHLLKVDPEILFRSDLSRIKAARKSNIVTAILEKATKLELFDGVGYGKFLSGLKHDQLETQLWPYIQNETLNVIVRRLALTIAARCGVTELNDNLLALLRKPEVEQQVRDGAARILCETLSNGQLSELEPLVRGESGPDPDDQIRGYVMSRLVPAHWSVAQALPQMTLPNNERFYGSYAAFLSSKAPDCVTVGDIPGLLEWLLAIDCCFDAINPFRDLAYRGLCLAIRNLEHPQIRNTVVRFWIEKRRKYDHPESGNSKELDALWTDDSIRRAFATEVIQHAQTSDEDVALFLYGAFSLLGAKDLPWILEKLPTVAPDQVSKWTHSVQYFASPEYTAKCWDLFLQKLEEIPELRARFPWLRAWEIDEPLARTEKARHLRDQRRLHRLEQKRNTPDPQFLIARDLERIADGKYWAWIHLNQHLFLKKGQNRLPRGSNHDIINSPGWLEADENQRISILDGAKQFLVHCSDGFDELRTRTNYSDPGYAAARLLRSDVDTDLILREAIVCKWIAAIVGIFNNAEEHYQEMAAIAYRLNPDSTVDALLREAENNYRNHGFIFAWRGFERCWDSRLSSILATFTVSHITKKDTLISSLGFLFKTDPPAFRTWMSAIVPRIERFPEDVQVTVLSIAHALAPSETWDGAWRLIDGNRQIGEKIMLTVAANLEFGIREKQLDLEPRKLGKVAELLYELFPPDARLERSGGIVTPRRAVADYRRKVMDALTASPDPLAGESLLDLAAKFPNSALEFKWRYSNQLETRRRTRWQPPSPRQLDEMMARAEARLVITDRDLLDVVQESLQRFEDYYAKSELPAAERLWRWQKDRNRPTDFEPKDEEYLSDELARWLRDDLGSKRGVIIGREVQIEQKMRTDLLIKAIVINKNGELCDPVTVVVEVKGCWNPRVKEDMEAQLVEKYLRPHGWTCGIYVVGWFVCDVWKKPRNFLDSAKLEDARAELRGMETSIITRYPDITIIGLALDCQHR